MHILSVDKKRISLRLLKLKERPGTHGPEFDVSGSEDSARYSKLVTSAARAAFEMRGGKADRPRARRGAPPAVFQERGTGRLRVAYKEAVIRFHASAKADIRKKVLAKYGFRVRGRNQYARNQYIVYDPERKCTGADLLDVVNDWATMDEVAFAVPNFVSEFHREISFNIHPQQWHLDNRATVQGQKEGEDVDARAAWQVTSGQPGVVIAVLDDGVDVDHPSFRDRIHRNPDPNEPRDLFGRDFFVDYDDREHFDPRPKSFKYPYSLMEGNDIHGTPCAGVIAASGGIEHVFGIAPNCRILPVKIFHADYLATDSKVADAIRYASSFADILSCSWSGPYSPDIQYAIEEAAGARGGKGVPIFCAAGNGYGKPVGYPAALPGAIAVGASTDKGRLAAYSNVGPEISIVAPSSGGVEGIYTTDVSYPNRGFNLGDPATNPLGLFTDDFGGTSSATPLAAGVAALVLSVNSYLTRAEVQGLLEDTADKIGSGSGYTGGHSPRFGHGRVNAAAALAAAGSSTTGKKSTGPPRRRKAGRGK